MSNAIRQSRLDNDFFHCAHCLKKLVDSDKVSAVTAFSHDDCVGKGYPALCLEARREALSDQLSLFPKVTHDDSKIRRKKGRKRSEEDELFDVFMEAHSDG